MKIIRLLATTLDVKATTPTKTPLGAIAVAIDLIVRIEADTGLIGWGEASAFGPITVDTQQTNLAMALEFGRLILGQDPRAVHSLVSTFKRVTTGEPSLRCILDTALQDIAAQAANMPFYQYLGRTKRTLVTDITIGSQNTVKQTTEPAQEALNQVFTELKLKVVRPRWADIAHVEAVRALAGPDITVRIVHDAETPVCADESLFTASDAATLARLDAADIFNIKLGNAGCLTEALKIAAITQRPAAPQ